MHLLRGAMGYAAMAYTLAAAAAAVNRNKTTVLRAIKAGKLSARRDEVSNGWMIEAAELHRFYGTAAPATVDATPRSDDAMTELRARLADKDEMISALRRLLDEERTERRQVQARLDALLTAPRRAWWPWRRS
jgi:hypothetical protein